MDANVNQPLERPQASESTNNFASHENFWKDTYDDIAKLSGATKGNGDTSAVANDTGSGSIDFGSSSSLYGSISNILKDLQTELSQQANSYSPTSDAAVQNLSNTGDSQLQQTLLSAWGDVQDGQLSQSAYNQFENASLPLTDPVSDLAQGLNFTTDIPLEQHALDSLSNLSQGDANTLQSLINSGSQPDVADTSPTTDSTTNPSGLTVAQLVAGDTTSNDTVLPGLVPTDSSYWGIGATGPFIAGQGYNNQTIPTTEANAWFIAFPKDGSTINPNDQIQVKGMDEYVLGDNGVWREVAGTQATDGLWSGAYPAEFNAASGTDTQVNNADGSVSISGIDGAANPVDNIYHGGIAGGDFNPATDQGVYVTLDAKVDPSAGSDSSYVMQVGNDFGGANGEGGITNTGSSGNANWVQLTDQYQQLAYSSLSANVLANDPPPGVSA